jgi:hypothetical protein
MIVLSDGTDVLVFICGVMLGVGVKVEVLEQANNPTTEM